MRIGSLCSGIGGLELGLERAGLGETVWQSEIDPAASRVLARHWPGVPNLGDFRHTELPACDLLCGGFPCQPVSGAGRRQGTDDERWLFDDIAAAVGRMASPPRLLVFENVRGLLAANSGAAMARVVHGLAALGYVGRYGLLRAADIGAPHRRERVFIVAHPDGTAGGPARPAGQAVPEPGTVGGLGRRDPRPPGWSVANPGGIGRDRGEDREGEGRDTPQRSETGGHPGDSVASWGPFAAAVAQWERLTRPAPGPTDNGRLSPAFVEWMMGFDEGWVDGLTRVQALRCLGNAVVPQVAERFGRMIAAPVPV